MIYFKFKNKRENQKIETTPLKSNIIYKEDSQSGLSGEEKKV